MKKRVRQKTEKIIDVINEPVEKEVISFKKIVSTGSTLLDLAISGSRVRGGGLPAGIILEVFGPSGAGKTAILAEIASSTQYNKGQVMFCDPEARLDEEYSRIYGMELDKENYHRPDTVNELFDKIWTWEPDSNVINTVCADSLAALSTEMEMEDEDKMGMKRAKDFSTGLRKTCRLIANDNLIIACSNQEREGTGGNPVTPGGKGIPYYSSVRIRITPEFKGNKIKKSKKIGGKTVEKITGIKSRCVIKKNSCDEPFRECNVSIVFNYGIDDVRDNLQYLKDMNGEPKFIIDDFETTLIDKAIYHVEEFELTDEIRELVIDKWEEINESFKTTRKRKNRR